MRATGPRRWVASLLFVSVCVAASAQVAPAPAAPELPAGLTAHWHSGKVIGRPPALTVVDLVGSNHIEFPGWLSVAPEGGLLIDGTQKAGVRLAQKYPVSPRFTLGVDMNPAIDGPEHQTLVYLYGFCELRYRASRGELTMNVWQISREEAGKQIISSVRLPVPAGKWSRVQVVISPESARLVVDGVPAETPLPGTWEFLPTAVPLFIGFGGSDRAYKGLFNHLYFAETR
ncbi:MAG: hypothetical protein MUE42_08475 [Opitutaceae bacterium]|jgi:hypothetical protein|nr:hypothetical protein [Opitutaceae bacterium]